MPKGEMIYRPATVEVEVLPPVDTSGWSVETIDEHVASVRNMYLEALDQDQSADTVKPLRVVKK
jgi:putative phosphoserine phosphatase/1-acylglycerol-3-phosphate O-acyltransferase